MYGGEGSVVGSAVGPVGSAEGTFEGSEGSIVGKAVGS